jgi:uncharacterized protein
MKSLRVKITQYTLLLVLVFSNFGILSAEQTLPKYTNYVNDYAGVLQPQDATLLNALLSDFEDSMGIQIAVVLEANSEYDAFDRAMFISRGWKIGNDGVNNGILVYLNIGGRTYHIATADKTQGKLTDGIVGDIGRQNLVPFLKQGDYYNGIRETVYGLAIAVKGEFKGRIKTGKKKESLLSVLLPIVLFGLFYLLFVRRGGGGGYSRGGFYTPPLFFGGSGFGGGGFGGSSGGGGFGGFGGGGGFNGGGAGGSW